jgi:uncharacterized membrane protein SpoIIM required for sporulation
VNVHLFITSSQERWNQLEGFIGQVSRTSLSRVPLDEFREGSLLYRQTLADLAYARMRFPTHSVVRDLEQLVGRAHSVIYQSRRVKRTHWREFWTRRWPRLVVDALPQILTATMIFLIASVVGFLLASQFPVLEAFFVSPPMRAAMNEGHLWTESITSAAPQESSAIATNNISVSILAYALGLTFGIGTIWLLVTNGLMLGVISAACLRAGVLGALAEFVVAHGALELPAIWIAAGAGLIMGEAMVFPRRYSRRVELRRAGARSVRLLAGVVPMLLIAGFVEGFVSPSNLPPALKIALAVGLAAVYGAYILSCARRTTAEAVPEY